jgi:alpha-glucosidase
VTESVDALAEVGAPPTWVLSSHDAVRHVTRYGGGTLGTRRARAAALLMLALPGGACLYQGEELGLPEVVDLPDDRRQDPTFLRSGRLDVGRDGCRVPLPWSGDRPPFGFGPSGEPWLPQPREWALLTAAQQAEAGDSMLALYRTALRLRADLDALGDGPFAWAAPGADGGDDVVVFRRGPHFVCVVNVGDRTIDPPAAVDPGAEMVLASAGLGADGRIPGATTVWYGQPPPGPPSS